MTDSRVAGEGAEVLTTRTDTPSYVAGAGAEVLTTRTDAPSYVAGAGAEVLTARADNPAYVAGVGAEVLVPAPWVRSMSDGSRVLQKHDDGVWRPFQLLGASQTPV